MADKLNPLWKPFAQWLAASELEREFATEVEWGKAHGVGDRTMRRWKLDPRFVELQESLAVASKSVVGDVVGSDDAASYQLVKSQLIDGALKGNAKYIDLYFRTYGKEFVAEEAAARTSDLASVDLDELVTRAVVALGDDLVAEALRVRGWRVERG